MKGRDRRAGKGRVVIPTLEARAVSGRNAECKVRILNRVGIRGDRSCRAGRRIVHHIGDRIAQRIAPLCVVVLIFRIHRVKRRDRRAGERRIVIPVLKGIAGAGCRTQGVIRVLNRVARERSVRVCRCETRRNRVVQRPLHVVGIRRAPLCVDRVIHRSRRVDGRNRGRETRVRIPAEEGVTRAGRCLQVNARIRHIEAARVACRIACRVARRRRIVQHIGNRIRKRCTPLRVEIGRVRIALCSKQRCRCRSRKTRIRKPAEEGIARAGRGAEGMIRRFRRVAREARIRVVCRLSCGIVQVICEVIVLCGPLRIVVLIARRNRTRNQSRDRGAREELVVIPAVKVVARPGHGLNRDVRIRDLIARYGVRVHRRARGAGSRVHIRRVLNVIVVFGPVCGHRNHAVIRGHEVCRSRSVRIGLTVRTGPAVKGIAVHGKVIREVCCPRAAGNGLIRHGTGRRLARRCVCDKLHRILVRVSGHGARYVGNRIGTDCSAARRTVIKGSRRKRRRIVRRRGRNRLAVVKVHADARHAVVADEARRRHMGGIPGESLGRRHGARIHGNRERHIDRTAARIGEAAVRTLHEEGAAAGHIDGAVVRDVAARRNTEGLAVRVDYDTRRDVLRHNRVVGQRNRRIAVLARPSNCVVEVTEVVPLAAHFHIGDIAGDERNRLVGCRRVLIIGTELDKETKNIDSRVPVIQVRQIVPCAGTVVNLHETFFITCSGHVRRVRLSGTPVRIGSVDCTTSVGFIKFCVRLRAVLPSPLMPATTRCVSMLQQVGENACDASRTVVVPVRNARRIVDTFETRTAGPSAFHRNIVKSPIFRL